VLDQELADALCGCILYVSCLLLCRVMSEQIPCCSPDADYVYAHPISQDMTSILQLLQLQNCMAECQMQAYAATVCAETNLNAAMQVRGLAYFDALQSSAASMGSSPISASVIGASALAAGESVLTFGFAAAAVEAAIRAGIVKPFRSATSA